MRVRAFEGVCTSPEMHIRASELYKYSRKPVSTHVHLCTFRVCRVTETGRTGDRPSAILGVCMFVVQSPIVLSSKFFRQNVYTQHIYRE